MRAEQAAVVPGELGSPIAAALALPMMHQAALAGFVLLGPKPTGEDYRPDEIEVLGWATHQVGLDLQAIRVRELELANVQLAERNKTLTELLAARRRPHRPRIYPTHVGCCQPPPGPRDYTMTGWPAGSGRCANNLYPNKDKKRPGCCQPGLGSFGRGCLKGTF